MSREDKLLETYKKFCLAEGNHHIASEFAIIKIQELVENFKVNSILEVGLGIGTIAGSLLKVNRDLAYTGTEGNEFCLRALKENLSDNYRNINLKTGISDIDENARFDLIIIDGKDLGFKYLKSLLSPNGIIVIEGDRPKQQGELHLIFPNQLFVHCISKEKNKEYSPFLSNQWQGGLKIIFVNPHISQRFWWIREKIKTKWRYLYFR